MQLLSVALNDDNRRRVLIASFLHTEAVTKPTKPYWDVRTETTLLLSLELAILI